VNYIIDGYNAQLSGVFTNTEVSNQTSNHKFDVALQLQF
jgi:hypothetical protein